MLANTQLFIFLLYGSLVVLGTGIGTSAVLQYIFGYLNLQYWHWYWFWYNKVFVAKRKLFCCSWDAVSVTTSKLNAQNIDCYRQIAGLMVLIASVCVFVLLTFLFQYATNNNYNYVVLCISVPIIYAKYWYWYLYYTWTLCNGTFACTWTTGTGTCLWST